MLYVNPYAADPALMHGRADSRQREDVALQQFERQFLREMLKSMRKMVPEGTLFPDSQQKALFDDMLDDQLAGDMAKSGQLGIAKQLREQLDRAGKRSDTTAAQDGLSLHRTQNALPIQKSGIALQPLTVEETGGIAWQYGKEGIRTR
ncbi:MAG: hypothetical protein GC168_11465 [Candidatus Hydrogenedens sp.]|nr:hypothetical protein [Candidatus Hydrogenedens sp.]